MLDREVNSSGNYCLPMGPTGNTRQREGGKAGRVGPLWRAVEARQRLGVTWESRGSASELWDNAVRFVGEQDSERTGGI